MIVDQLNQAWSSGLQFLNGIVVPDWGSLVNLLPIFLVVGVAGPLLTLVAFFWFVYAVRKPRVAVAVADPRYPIPRDADGNLDFPRGEPYSPTELMVYGPGTVRSDRGEDLLVACPKCGLVRSAAIDTCGNCGLSFTVRTQTITVRPKGPPPGGSALA